MQNNACGIEQCEKPRYYLKEWCIMHYRRWQRNGDPEARQVYRGDPAGSIAARSKREGECLIWTGAMSDDGYGIMKVKGKTRQAHLVAWDLANGPIPEGMQIDHICYNRACLEPKHLRLATHSQNQWNQSGSTAASGYRNVYPAKGGGYYVQIRCKGQQINFGSYSTAREAGEVASAARSELFGEFAGRG